MVKIFISYRRADTQMAAGRIYDRLVAKYGHDNVFKDVDSIPAGKNFRQVFSDWIGKADVMLVLIGTQWLTLRDENGNRRIDNVDDFVRYEVNLGLQLSHVAVIPVLVGHNSMPSTSDLPEALREIPYLNAVLARNDPDFHRDMNRLINSLDSYLQDEVTSSEIEGASLEEKPQNQSINVQVIVVLIGLVGIVLTALFSFFQFYIPYRDAPNTTQTAIVQVQPTTGQEALEFLSATSTPTNTPNATATLIAFSPQQNDDWTPIEQDFDGVTMVLVPVGCFTMGNDSNSYNGTTNGGEQCFDEPFWIDQTEVTQSDFERLGGIQADPPDFEGENRPVEDITWFEAGDFCALRGGRLPTEAEWEYVARGPDELFFPWGNEWDVNNTVSSRSSSQGTGDVGSILAGASWLGALNMSDNLWEWTRSVYEAYPYVLSDRHEDGTVERTDTLYTLRGGSWGDYDAGSLRSATRFWVSPYYWGNKGGFRCTLSYE